MPRTPGRYLGGVALNIDDSLERVNRERPRYLQAGNRPSPSSVDYNRHAELERAKFKKERERAKQARKLRTVDLAWEKYPTGIGRKPRLNATPSTGTPGVKVWESTDWRDLGSDSLSCTALEKVAKHREEKARLRALRKACISSSRDHNRFRPSWMQVEKPRRKPGEGRPTTAVPQDSMASRRSSAHNSRSRGSDLSSLQTQLPGSCEPDRLEVKALRRKVKQMSRQIKKGTNVLKGMKKDMYFE